MKNELKGKKALVLGAIKGIGKGIALALAREGADIALTYNDWPEALPELKKDLAGIETESILIPIDLLETDKIPEMIRKVVDRFGGIDILINNIERGGWPVVHGSYTKDQWDLELATTLRAKQWVFNEALPHLKASKNGNVVNISSIAGIVGRSGPAGYLYNEGYSTANRGVSLLTETWARMGAPEVRVNEIMVGIFETRHGPGTRGWGLLTDEQKQAIVDHTLLKRLGKIDDIVRTLLFIIKDGTYFTGSVFRLDGGYVLGGESVPEMPKGVV